MTQEINMYLNFYMLYYNEYANANKYKIYEHT